MQKSLEDLLNELLLFSERLEEDMKQESDLKSLTTRQLYCIESIKDMNNPSLSELALHMNIAKASMSVMVDRLSKHQYIYRVTSDNDRRSAHIHLTEKGERASQIHTELHKKIASLLTADMTSSEKEILNVLLNKSVNSLRHK